MDTAGGARPAIVPFGESALLVVFSTAIDLAANSRVHALARVVQEQREQGGSFWGRPVPAYGSLLVPYDSEQIDHAAALAALGGLALALPVEATWDEAALVTIPVRYGGADGPDLAAVAERQGLAPDTVIAIHTGATYRVFMLGFTPGFAYLGPLPASLVLPRRESPRTRVPAGSVAIAGQQTGVYPLATPGGWHLLGRTDAPLWDAGRASPALLRPGQRVRFVAL